LIDVLTVSKWRDQLRRHRVRLCGVRIDGTIDLSDTDISSELWVAARGIKGNLILASSHWDRLPGLSGLPSISPHPTSMLIVIGSV
jgi:hypothetical protein